MPTDPSTVGLIPAGLSALVDAVVPPTADSAGGWIGGVGDYVTRAWDRELSWAQQDLIDLVDPLGAAPGIGERLAAAAMAPTTARAVRALVRVCREGYYGGSVFAPPAGWASLGYRPWPEGVTPRRSTAYRRPELKCHYDVIVIGSGPGGGAAARVLTAAGASVLVVERARDLSDSDLAGDHLHGKRMSVYDPTAGPGGGNPRVVEELDGSTWTADGDGDGDAWGLNAMVLGGGTRLWQGMAWRFLPEDFRMASEYGVPDGSSLADWPVDAAVMAPYYDRAEFELGVAGELGPLTRRMPEHPGYPMPALPADPIRGLLGAAADRRGWEAGPIPFAINSVPRDGRAACVGCHQCMGHACPVEAKNGSQNTVLSTALASGRCDLLLAARAVAIEHRSGRASGVRILEMLEYGPRAVTVEADLVVLAAGAIETPRLLLASGLGNDQVGRHLQNHVVGLVAGMSGQAIPTFRGPGHSVATFEFVHGGGAPYGGGVLFDSFAPYPLQLANWADAFGVPSFGQEHTAWMHQAVGSIVGAMCMGQELPMAEARITLDPNQVDDLGVPVARLHAAQHPDTARVRAFLMDRCRDWLDEAGVEGIVDVFSAQPVVGRRSPASEHAAGTVRMGVDQRTSATDPSGLVHGTANVYVCDGSLHPSNGSVNPTLTLLANAFRVAELLAAS